MGNIKLLTGQIQLTLPVCRGFVTNTGMQIESVASGWAWGGFALLVVILLALDLGILNRKAHEVKFREALINSLIWIAVGLGFGVYIFFHYSQEYSLLYLQGYLIEKALSFDNLFVIMMVFNTFRVPKNYLHRVLFWGIFGAIVMRAIFIFVGVALVTRFEWILYVFGAILVYTAIKMLFKKDEEEDPKNSFFVKIFQRFFPFTPDYVNGYFFTTLPNGKRVATLLFLVLFVVEGTDLIFAVDSIPAIFVVTQDPFIILTSNIFAILGLRSLFFLLYALHGKLRFLNFGLSAILLFIGCKMLFKHFIHVDENLSLGIIGGLLFFTFGASWMFPEKKNQKNTD